MDNLNVDGLKGFCEFPLLPAYWPIYLCPQRPRTIVKGAKKDSFHFLHFAPWRLCERNFSGSLPVLRRRSPCGHISLTDRIASLVPELTGRRIFDAHLFSLYHAGFLVGVLLFRHREALADLDWRIPLALGLLGLPLVSSWVSLQYTRPDASWHVATQPFGVAGVGRVVGYALCSGLLLQALLGAERRGAFARMPCALRALGNRIADASYVLYLSHFFVYSLLAKAYLALGVPQWLAPPALALAGVAAVLFAIAVHLAVERSLLRAIRARI